MPRRKRTSGDGGRRAKVCRMVHFEEPLVISDSEHEEEEDCAVDHSSREARWKRRKNRSQLQEMTEDEMLNLAMRLSAQEANSAAQRRELEDSDIQKAIEESLHVADEDGSVDASSSSAKSHQSVSNEISHLRRKLSYPSQTQAHDGRESPAVQDRVTEKESTSPLPEMPDLSQATSSLPSSSSSSLMCGPSVASQHVHESSQDKTPDRQLIIKDSEENKLSESQPKPSPAFPRYGSFVRQPLVCVEKLSQVLISASTGSRDQLHTQDTAVGPTSASASQSQEDSSLPASYVLTQNDLRERTDMVDDTHDQNASEGNESDTQIPDSPTYVGREGSSSKNPDPDKCKSPSKPFQPSSPSCVPENADTDVTKSPDQDQVKDQITQVENSEKGPNKQSWDKFHSHMVLHLDDDDDDSEEVLSPSPVLKDKTVRKKLSRIQPCISSAATSLSPSIQDTQISQHALQEDSSKDLKSKSSDSKSLYTSLGDGDCTVSYYWGVPFCPRGQNPDDYTRVIMCQLEVYEKSLKDAQRELLRKADWSQPVFPDSSERPFGTRRLKRYRAPLLSEEEEQNDDEGEKESKRKEVEEERQEAKEESVEGSEDGAEGGQSETYVVLSSPENKDEDVQKKPFLSRDQSTTATTPFRNDQWDTSDNTQIERADEEEEEAQNNEQTEDEEIVCPETQLTPELMMTSPAQPPSRADSEVMEVDDEGGVPAAEEEMMEQENVSVDTAPPQRMECPICCKLFPLSRIQMHAALCDGETDNPNQQEDDSQAVRKMRTRKDPAEESQKRTEKSAQMEKCFLCQGLFPSQQYTAHVNFCLKKTDSNISQGDGLLSALERTEQRHTSSDEAGPSDVSSKSKRGPADSSGGSIDHSAITSSTNFIPASDDMDCCTDFQQQDSSRNSQRLTRKRKFKR